MTEGLPLFAPHRAVETSRQAARAISPRLKALHAKILGAMEGTPMTPDQCAAAIGEHYLDVRPRFSELQKAGKITRQRDSAGKLVKVPSVRGNPMCVFELKTVPLPADCAPRTEIEI